MLKLPDGAFKKGIENPTKVIEYLKRSGYKLYKKPYLTARTANQIYYHRFGEAGTLDIMEEEWDTLILADACRYDYFEEESTLSGDLESRFSPGSMSYEFMQASFADQKFHDTVYVTANPFAADLPERTFYNIISLIDEYYENDMGTVPAKTIRKKTREAHEEFPNKRIIAHFMQPHEPFLSDFGEKVSKDLNWAGNQYHLSRGQTVNDLRRAYRENVNIALTEIEKLVEEISGKIVVSSDHGEMLGERLFPIPIRGYEHPKSIYTEELLKVPWLTIEKGRREIIKDSPKKSGEIASEEAKKRLKKLGYI